MKNYNSDRFQKSSPLAHINEKWVDNNMIDRQTLVVVSRSYGFLWVNLTESQSQAETSYTTLMISTEYQNPTDSFYMCKKNKYI